MLRLFLAFSLLGLSLLKNWRFSLGLFLMMMISFKGCEKQYFTALNESTDPVWSGYRAAHRLLGIPLLPRQELKMPSFGFKTVCEYNYKSPSLFGDNDTVCRHEKTPQTRVAGVKIPDFREVK